jgi:tetratricopeptide (TPR) repeat protein
MEDFRWEKIDILIQQNKYKDAEKFLADILRDDPNDVEALNILAEIYLQQNNYEKANAIIENAIGINPDNPNLFYTKSKIAVEENKLKEAEVHINQAIELYPYDADYFAFLAYIKLSQKKFNEALEKANNALEIDAENLLALNTRSTALIKLNRKEESFETIEGALREDPNNSYTHANYGWNLLEKGNHKKALEHFKESLSNNPNFQYAQAGMLEAIKASNPIYRLFLKYSFFMNNLTAKYQWAVIIGFYLITKGIRAVAQSNDKLEPYLFPIIFLLSLIAISTWIIQPISNLFLRFNKYGQFLLDEKEKLSANFVGASCAVFIIGLMAYFVTSDERMLVVAVFGFAMMLPLGIMFAPSKNKNLLLIYTIILGVFGLSAIYLNFANGTIFNIMTTLFLFGFIAFQWVSNYFMIKDNN